ncbi:hypothetical protein NA78x_005658 [Anatilimnocola sp. NA78]|uniref:hypothetical protein n=1 Tax=Anatilimnocola sp. NA78 TaxID=3415683 RepID=UPI003CE5A5E2
MLRCSIRELLLVTLIAALAVGWLVDHRAQASRRTAAELKAKAAATDAKFNALEMARVQGQLDFIKKYGLPFRTTPYEEHTLEMRLPEPPLRDPDL